MKKPKLYTLLVATLLSSLASAACNLTYNANGSLMIDTQCNHYQYNAKEQLIAIKSPKRSLQCNYTYSPEGLRDAKICRSSDNHRLQLDFIYQNNQLINAEDRQHNSQSAYLGKDVRYVVNAFKQNAYYFSAAVHSTTSLLLTATANLKQTYNFSSYGQNRLFVQNNPSKTINFSQPLTYSPLTYDGEYQDPETGFVYLRARFYNPRQLRFMQRDNYNLLNRYNAFDGNPVNNVDPSGHTSLSSMFNVANSIFNRLSASVGLASLFMSPTFSLPAAVNFALGLAGIYINFAKSNSATLQGISTGIFILTTPLSLYNIWTAGSAGAAGTAIERSVGDIAQDNSSAMESFKEVKSPETFELTDKDVAPINGQSHEGQCKLDETRGFDSSEREQLAPTNQKYYNQRTFLAIKEKAGSDLAGLAWDSASFQSEVLDPHTIRFSNKVKILKGDDISVINYGQFSTSIKLNTPQPGTHTASYTLTKV
ncbi:RHS repeat-associated core domain-containing protein [Facilibium subflavum]|uniref:RHS repeat-associated core domain-containing protein n=1 Tax=Facilibium subflavum TaxID=2219058 RepID=UPI000E65BEA0|nr:RHS repeat-associated core domain-containing protein [Facilibium subflavum]